MLLSILLTFGAAASPADCERDFHERMRPADAPAHHPPPLGPLLDFAWDLDDSGDLDDHERARLRADQAARCDALQDRFDDADTNGDGRIDDAERARLHDRLGGPPPRPPAGPPPPRGALPPPVLDAFDRDGDGHLSGDERAAARDTIRRRFRDGLPPVPHRVDR